MWRGAGLPAARGHGGPLRHAAADGRGPRRARPRRHLRLPRPRARLRGARHPGLRGGRAVRPRLADGARITGRSLGHIGRLESVGALGYPISRLLSQLDLVWLVFVYSIF